MAFLKSESSTERNELLIVLFGKLSFFTFSSSSLWGCQQIWKMKVFQIRHYFFKYLYEILIYHAFNLRTALLTQCSLQCNLIATGQFKINPNILTFNMIFSALYLIPLHWNWNALFVYHVIMSSIADAASKQAWWREKLWWLLILPKEAAEFVRIFLFFLAF